MYNHVYQKKAPTKMSCTVTCTIKNAFENKTYTCACT